MAIHPCSAAHPALGPLPGTGRYRFFELADARGVYAAAAIAEHPDALELHLSVVRFGPRAARALREDVAGLRDMARALGKRRVVGVRSAEGADADPLWDRFTRAFGFTNQRTHQCAELMVDP